MNLNRAFLAAILSVFIANETAIAPIVCTKMPVNRPIARMIHSTSGKTLLLTLRTWTDRPFGLHMTLDEAKNWTKRHEGYRDKPYRDSLGHWSLGWGHNMANPLPKEALDLVFEYDFADAWIAASEIVPFWSQICLARRFALTDMAFQLGKTGLSKFKRMLEAISAGDWDLAAEEAMDSLWAQQTPRRAAEVSDVLRTGRKDAD